jgi:adenosylcobinamide-GDP ribazoletransferase
MFRGLVTALRTLTILPVPGKEAEKLSSALPWFPFVGLLIGGALYGIMVLYARSGFMVWPEGVAAAIVACSIVLTRAMHLDGLADAADGFGCRKDKATVLSVMKDPHVGAFGVIAIVAALLIRFVAITRLVASGPAIVVLAAAVVSRTMLVEIATTLPYARTEGGTASPFVSGSTWKHRLAGLITGALLLCATCGPVVGGASLIVGWLICRVFAWWCKKKIQGVTGDLLGACSEIVETAVLFGGAALSGHFPGYF